MKAKHKEIVKLFFEANTLGNIPRSGWQHLGLKDEESITDHSFNAMLIGFILAKLEGVDENKVLRLLLFHDLADSRIGDISKVMTRYLEPKKAEEKALQEMVKGFPRELAQEINSLKKEFEARSSREAVIAVQADLLQNAVKAKQLIDQGHERAQDWITNIKNRLKAGKATHALELLKEIEHQDSCEWWQGLKNIPKKL